MNPLKSIVLGAVQGATEFLPISSTSHLRIVPAFLGWSDPGAAYTAVIQLGTTAAVLIFFRADLLRIARGFLGGALRQPRESFRRDADVRMGWYLIAATIPIGLAGLAFSSVIESSARSLYVIGTALIVFSVVMVAAERRGAVVAGAAGPPRRGGGGLHPRTIAEVRPRDAVIVGLAQTLALIPGVSRSGATISAGLFAGLDRAAAARFSFLLSSPAIALAGVYEFAKNAGALSGSDVLGYAIGIAVAFVVGYAAIAFLLRFLATNTMLGFVAYRVGLGALVLILTATSVID